MMKHSVRSIAAVSLSALLLWWVCGSVPAGGQSSTADASIDLDPEKIKVQTYKDYGGIITYTVRGNRGSFVQYRVDFEGLYVLPRLDLTRLLKSGRSDIGAQITDTYEIYPMAVKFTSRARINRKIYTEDGNGSYSTSAWTTRWSQCDREVLPVPPETPACRAEVARWRAEITKLSRRKPFGFIAKFVVLDRSPAGGKTFAFADSRYRHDEAGRMSWSSYGFDNRPVGTYDRNNQSNRPVKGAFSSARTSKVDAMASLSSGYFGLPGASPRTMELVSNQSLMQKTVLIQLQEFNLKEFGFSQAAEITAVPPDIKMMLQKSRAVKPPRKNEVLSDTQVRASFSYVVGIKQEVDATLESVEADEEKYLPLPKDKRRYKLTIGKESRSKVEGVRFVLDGVTHRPGVATNAGNHIKCQQGQCDDCLAGAKVEFSEIDFNYEGHSLSRLVTHYSDCPVDSLPDMFFASGDNNGYDLGQDSEELSRELKDKITLQLSREGNDAENYTVTLSFRDGAAWGFLRAEVQIGGVWLPAKAAGPTADEFGACLMIPLDKNDNGMCDAWGGDRGSASADEDDSAKPGESGDGLTVMEEYRGLYMRGKFGRLNPTLQDLFVHDSTGQFEGDLSNTQLLYFNDGIRLHILDDNELRRDVVNYQSIDVKAGDQYSLVVVDTYTIPDGMTLVEWSDIWRRLDGKASHHGPPTAANHTVWIQPGHPSDPYYMSGLLGHEMGHNINCTHHGADIDVMPQLVNEELNGQILNGRTYIGMPAGPHSGDFRGIMRYNCAKLFCSDASLPMPIKDHQSKYMLNDKSGTREYFADSKQGSGDNPGEAFTGPATHGPAQAQIKIRSY
jgi:hypothetical protein